VTLGLLSPDWKVAVGLLHAQERAHARHARLYSGGNDGQPLQALFRAPALLTNRKSFVEVTLTRTLRGEVCLALQAGESARTQLAYHLTTCGDKTPG
jgi:hypothetical protein